MDDGLSITPKKDSEASQSTTHASDRELSTMTPSDGVTASTPAAQGLMPPSPPTTKAENGVMSKVKDIEERS